MKRSSEALVLAVLLLGCGETKPPSAEKQDVQQAAPPENVPTKPNTPRYTIVHSVMVDGKEEFMSVVVQPGISDSELLAVATELHKLHPRSNISFYDTMEMARIKQYWKCFLDALHKVNNPRCPEGPDEWINDHKVGSVGSYFDNPNRTGQPKWFLEGGGFRRIGYLGVDDRLAEKLAPQSAPERPQIGETVRLRFGQLKVVEVALTPGAYGEFTQCFDRAGSVNCVARLLDIRKIFQVPSGTKAQVLAFRDNPSGASLLKGGLAQVRVLEGAFRGQPVWTLEDHIVK